MTERASIGILSDFPLDGLGHGTPKSISAKTPFGEPTSALSLYSCGTRNVALIQRQGEQSTDVNHRANLFALKQLGVRFVVSVTFARSLREMIAPGIACAPGQIVPGLAHGPHESFFGQGISAQVDLYHPICSHLQTLLFQSAKIMGADTHWNSILLALGSAGTATKSECDAYRRHACDIIAPIHLSEARLALEAEMSYACLALVDHYALHRENPKTASTEALQKTAAQIHSHLMLQIPAEIIYPAHKALATAIKTPRAQWPAATIERLNPLLKPYL